MCQIDNVSIDLSFVSQTVSLNILKQEFENDNYDNSLVTVKGASAKQKFYY